MARLHAQYDTDPVTPGMVTAFRTVTNRFEIPCRVCGRPLYVGESTAHEIERAIEHDLDNPLTCSECERSVDELDYR
jgi:hypothetical protein